MVLIEAQILVANNLQKSHETCRQGRHCCYVCPPVRMLLLVAVFLIRNACCAHCHLRHSKVYLYSIGVDGLYVLTSQCSFLHGVAAAGARSHDPRL